MNPIDRANSLNMIIAFSGLSLRRTAVQMGVSHSVLSEWLRVLDLSPGLQAAINDELLGFTIGMRIARLNLLNNGGNKMITSENIHIWTNTQGNYLVSDENIKKLYDFACKDDAVNALYTLGHKASARELHHNTTL